MEKKRIKQQPEPLKESEKQCMKKRVKNESTVN